MRTAALAPLWGFLKPDAKRPHVMVLRLLAVALVLWVLLGGNRGFLALLSLQREKWRLESEIKSLDETYAGLSRQKAALERQSGYYEKKAREELMLAKPGEIIYRFKEE
jgi:cell division protein FtsB